MSQSAILWHSLSKSLSINSRYIVFNCTGFILLHPPSLNLSVQSIINCALSPCQVTKWHIQYMSGRVKYTTCIFSLLYSLCWCILLTAKILHTLATFWQWKASVQTSLLKQSIYAQYMYCYCLSQLSPNWGTFGLSQDLAQIRAGISVHLNKPLLSPLRYG